jgi:tetratricopeptide (TPR) repeat protein
MIEHERVSKTSIDGLIAAAVAAYAGADHKAALARFERALELVPGHIAGLNGRGLTLSALGDRTGALLCFAQVLRAEPGNVFALVNSGVNLAALDRPAEALLCFDRALNLAPDGVEARLGRGLALHALGRLAESADALRAVLALAPDHPDALLNLGLVLGELDEGPDGATAALACFERLLTLQPDRAAAINNRAIALGKLHRHHEAIACAREGLARLPEHPGLLLTLGFNIASLNRHEEALPYFDRVLAADPAFDEARDIRSLILLAMGDYAAGFREHEVRWRITRRTIAPLRTASPLWLGQEPLEGRTILLHYEQGFGDTLQFIRYAPLVAARGAKVVLRVPQPLCRLLRSAGGVAAVASEAEPIPEHDFHCPMMSLPLAFGTTLDTIPTGVPYLQADRDQAAVWDTRLSPRTPGRRRIGIAWAGRQFPPINHDRDMPLPALRPLLHLPADWISLQMDLRAQDRDALARMPGIVRAVEQSGDFADTAGLIANLDLVVTVDTAVAHLAAALGKPVWIMNRYFSCWRWLRDRADSPWYPNVRLFRQRDFGDWDGVVADVAIALDGFG